MKRGISDQAAIEFSIGFYDALGAGKSIEEAFRFGRNAIQLYNIPEHLTPVILKKRPTPKVIMEENRDTHVFRFRAESEHDVNELRKILKSRIEKIIRINETPYPDVEVEIHVDLSLDELREAMEKVEDGHVMVETVAHKDNYTGERNQISLMDAKEREHLRELRQTYQRRLHRLEIQEASFGIRTPPEILIEIEDIRAKIIRIDTSLGDNPTSLQHRGKGHNSNSQSVRHLQDAYNLLLIPGYDVSLIGILSIIAGSASGESSEVRALGDALGK